MERTALTVTGVLVILAVVALMVFLICGGAPFLVEFPLRLLFGWVAFITRNATKISVSGSGLLMFVLLFAATWMLIHYLGRSLLTGGENPIQIRTTLAATVLVVALFSAGIGATGVAHQMGWLIRSPEPLLGGDSQAARRMSDSNNQKQVALGFQNFHSAYEESHGPFRFSTLQDSNGTLLHGWQTQLLPFVEQQALYESIDKTQSWRSQRNLEPLGQVVAVYTRLDGAPETSITVTGSYALSHLAANRLLFGDAKIARFMDIRDGAANTILFGSSRGQFLPWGHPQGWRSSEFLPNQQDRGFGSGFQGGCHITMVDGSVRFITDSIDPTIWKALFTPNGGESIEE